VTAANHDFVDDSPAPVERTCRTVVDGRRAARALAEWLRRFELSEPEFQVLWRLRDVAVEGLDQTTLANQLALSPAQVSATVERLGTRGWIIAHSRPEDRRRRLWQLSASGRTMLQSILSHVDRLPRAVAPQTTPTASAMGREAAA
jgi:DNA-binding MarR family transcriptional regulator